METMHYVGLDVHKKTISYCVKNYQGCALERGTISSTRPALLKWLDGRTVPWLGAMEATMFTGWIYDFLKPHAADLKVAHPEMLKAITVAKKKNDRADAEKLADLLRVNLLPECTMMPAELRELRRILRYRNTSRQAVSYCGLCSAQRESAGKELRGPLSKKRNKYLQTMLIEAAKLAPRWNPQLKIVHERALQKGNRNRATLEVARRLVKYLLAVDRRGTPFVPQSSQ